jgi:hypothetical protein
VRSSAPPLPMLYQDTVLFPAKKIESLVVNLLLFDIALYALYMAWKDRRISM